MLILIFKILVFLMVMGNIFIFIWKRMDNKVRNDNKKVRYTDFYIDNNGDLVFKKTIDTLV